MRLDSVRKGTDEVPQTLSKVREFSPLRPRIACRHLCTRISIGMEYLQRKNPIIPGSYSSA